MKKLKYKFLNILIGLTILIVPAVIWAVDFLWISWIPAMIAFVYLDVAIDDAIK